MDEDVVMEYLNFTNRSDIEIDKIFSDLRLYSFILGKFDSVFHTMIVKLSPEDCDVLLSTSLITSLQDVLHDIRLHVDKLEKLIDEFLSKYPQFYKK